MNSFRVKIAKGGFIIYVDTETDSEVEVYVSPRKLMQRVKQVIDELKLVDADTK